MMKRCIVASLGSLIASAGIALAQPALQLPQPDRTPTDVVQAAPDQADPPAPAPAAAPLSVSEPSQACCDSPCAAPCRRFWASSEYLLWWITDAPIPIPLVTTGGAGAADPGVIGAAGTEILLGNSSVDYGSFSGARVTAGAWLNGDDTVGFEISGFMLEHRANTFQAASTGAVFLSFPIFNPDQGAESRVRFGGLGEAGGTTITSSNQLWGAEASGLLNLVRNDRLSLDVLVGFRYLNLREVLDIRAVLSPGTALAAESQDVFETQNQFFGGQIGARAAFRAGGFSAEATAKVALGANLAEVDVAGQSATAGVVRANGIFAQPTNSGTNSDCPATAIPEASIRLGYTFRERVHAYVGYDVLYWSHIARPGDQVDRNLNFVGNGAPNLRVVGTPITTGSPLPRNVQSDAWIHGLSFGLSFRY